MAEITNSNDYNEEQIQVLKGLQAVRVRPGMYIGTTSSRGLHHLINEIVDNSIDEAMAGYCDKITVTLHKDGSCSVSDDGRGIPAGINAETGKPTVEVVFTVLHAGGKFGGGGYKISGGLHGVGASVVNALSEWMELVNCHNGEKYSERFERGEVARPFSDDGPCGEQHGLYVRFMPDKEIFETVEFDFDSVVNRMREQAFLNAGVRIVIKDERGDEPVETDLCYEGGLKSFVEYINNNKHCGVINQDVIHIKGEKGDMSVEVALQYNTSYEEMLVTFANNMATIEGGTHEAGFKTALTRVINDYGRKVKLLKPDEKGLTGDDVREGLTAVISVKLPDAQFESQTKAKLGNSEVKTLVDNVVYTKLEEYLEENPAAGRAIMDKAMAAARTRVEVLRAREASRNRKGALESFSLPDKLADCHERSSELTELFLVEGDSAGGSAKDGRDSRFQAILPLRGKILNVEKSRIDKVYANESVLPIIQALGCGIGPDFDINRLRYGKIIIMADADVDGSHIRILLLTFFFRFMRGLIEDGHVYSAIPPLYKVIKGKTERYAFSDAERDSIISELGGSGCRAERYKGLGEMDKEQLWDTTMDPGSRTIMRVMIDDAIRCDEIFSTLMGAKVEPRREFIEKNAKYVQNLDV